MTDDGQQQEASPLNGANTRPRARDHAIVTARVADELIVYDLERHVAHRLNRTAGLLWTHCNGEHSAAQLGVLLQPDFHGQLAADVVAYGLGRLHRKRLLRASSGVPVDVAICSRRELLRRLALAGITVGLPVVASLAVPTALMAQASCLPLGAACSPQGLLKCCALFHCNGGVCK
ncbi:MAG: hypothetical protein PVSMB1_08720 [Gemmatimonadaceae bacterium]